jgi:hypothetical protein
MEFYSFVFYLEKGVKEFVPTVINKLISDAIWLAMRIVQILL